MTSKNGSKELLKDPNDKQNESTMKDPKQGHIDTKELKTKVRKQDNSSHKSTRRKTKTNFKVSPEALRISELRKQLETYFHPQNFSQDHFLRSNMTKDGYVDIILLLDLKLIRDLLKDDQRILIKAIRSSKCLRMNSQETMVKYMTLIERKTLIIRDLPTNTPKKDVTKIFENPKCSKPKEIKSDIADHWFVTFDTEEECTKTVLHLQKYGEFNGKKLNVRVKTVNSTSTKSEAIYTPDRGGPGGVQSLNSQVKQTPTRYPSYSPPYQQQISPYISPSKILYQPAPQPIQPAPPTTFGYKNQSPTRITTINSRSSKPKVAHSHTNLSNNRPKKPKPESTKPQRNPISDYPGTFARYSKNKFFEVYNAMNKNDNLGMEIPESMRGRDSRVVSEERMVPVSLLTEKATKTERKEKAKQNKDYNEKRKRKMQKGKHYGVEFDHGGYYPAQRRQYYDNYQSSSRSNSYNYYQSRYHQRRDDNYDYYNNQTSRHYSNKGNKGSYYRPRNQSNNQNKNKNKNEYETDIIYGHGRRNFVKGWKPKHTQG